MINSRFLVLQILESISQGAHSDEALDYYLKTNQKLKQPDRALITELSYGILRWQLKLDYILKEYVKGFDKLVSSDRELLRIGAYQLLFLDRVPAYAAINETVKLARKKKKGFINAVLRNIERGSRGHERLPLEIKYAHPAWMIKYFLKNFGEENAFDILMVNNTVAPLTIRVNSLKCSREALKEEIKKEHAFLKNTPCSPVGIQIKGISNVYSLTSYTQGYFSVQDEASQLVVLGLFPIPGERVLDCCAAPGGKTIHLAELMKNQGEIIALDKNKERFSFLEENLKRTGIGIVKIRLGDAAKKIEGQFDKILVDAPCSGLGTIRRAPEIKWRRAQKDILRLAKRQREILENVSQNLKKKGVLVYSVCTLTAAEGKDLIDKFLIDYPQFRRESLAKILPLACHQFVTAQGDFFSFPQKNGMDGFYFARLMKQ